MYFRRRGDEVKINAPKGYRLGINTGFAVNRYAEPEEWIRIVGEELELKVVQFTADMLNVDLPANVIVNQVDRIQKASVVTDKYFQDKNQKLKIIDRYDGQGNIVQHRQSDKHEPITLIWGYNKQYLIAKIENASVSKIANALGISSNSVESLNEHDLNDIDNLRDILKGSLITTYRYKPLVGIISKTNSSNKKTFYQYDSQNRLEFVKDHNGNIIKEYNYHYKTN